MNFLPIIIISSLFGPLPLFASSFISACFTSNTKSLLWRIICFCLILAQAIAASSRKIGFSPYDDLANVYYPNYLELKINLLSVFSVNNLSLEFFFNIFLGLISLVPITLTDSGLAFVFAITAGIINFMFLDYLVNTDLIDLDQKQKATLIIISLLIFSYGLSTQLVRQIVAAPIALISIFSQKRKQSLVFFVISSGLHASNIFMIPLYKIFLALLNDTSKLLRLRPSFGFLIRFILMLGVSYLLIVLVTQGILVFNTLLQPLGLGDKLNFYNNDFFAGDLSYDYSLFEYYIIALFSSLSVIANRSKLPRLSISLCFMYFILLPANLPLLPARLTLYLYTTLLGPLITLFCIRRFPGSLALSLLLVTTCALYNIPKYLSVATNEFALWDTFDSIYLIPFWFWGVFIDTVIA